MSFLTGTQMEQLYSLSSSVTKNTYTTEAAFSGVAGTNTVCTLDANYFRNDVPNPVGRSLYLRAMGTIGNTASATFAINLGLDAAAGTKGGTGGGSTAVVAATNFGAGPFPWTLEAWMTCTAFATSTYTLQVNGSLVVEQVASAAAAVATALRTSFSNTIASLDPRILLYVELFGTWSASSSSNTTTLTQMLLFGSN